MQPYRVCKARSGAVLVYVAIALVALIGMAALAIDLGQLYVAKQRAQNVCDAVVLSGVQELSNHYLETDVEWAARQAADDCAATNNQVSNTAWKVFLPPEGTGEYPSVEGVNVTFPTTVTDDAGNTFTVEPYHAITAGGCVHVNFGFAGIFGFDSKDVHASATAILAGVDNIPAIPLGVSEKIADSGMKFGDPWELSVPDWQSGFLGPGNWLSLRLSEDDQGVPDYVARLAGEADPVDVSIGENVDTETGGTAGTGMGSKTYEGLIGKFSASGKLINEGRLLKETDPQFAPTDIYTGYNPDAWQNWQDSYDEATKMYAPTQRIVIMPILEDNPDVYDISGMKPVLVVGFAGFFINRVYDGTDGVHPKGEIEGFFVQGIVQSDGELRWILPEPGWPINSSNLIKTTRLIS